MTRSTGDNDQEPDPPLARPTRICLVYDCLFPWTIGGAERWYRALSNQLVAAGHDVTYLTLRQWGTNDPPAIPGVRVVAVGPPLPLYVAAGGRRRLWPPLRFGLGVGWHLLRHGRRYDLVRSASFPYFPLLAAALLRPLGRYALLVDWWEVWTRDYWRDYLGVLGGAVGWAVQRLCVRLPQHAHCFSGLHAARLRQEGLRGEPTLLRAVYAGPIRGEAPQPADPLVIAIGRLIPEKRVSSLPPALALARRTLPALRGVIVGDGPERAAIARAVAEQGLVGLVDMPGFVTDEARDRLLRRALCLVLPSLREGFGLVVVEAAASGVPSIVVPGPDNAATELIVDGINGVLAASTAPEALASAILRVHAAGPALRRSTAAWFAANAASLSLDASPSSGPPRARQ